MTAKVRIIFLVFLITFHCTNQNLIAGAFGIASDVLGYGEKVANTVGSYFSHHGHTEPQEKPNGHYEHGVTNNYYMKSANNDDNSRRYSKRSFSKEDYELLLERQQMLLDRLLHPEPNNSSEEFISDEYYDLQPQYN